MQALPAIIIWELWKQRNNYKYGDTVTVSRVIYQVSSTLQSLVRYKKLGLHHVPHKWPELIDMMEKHTPKLRVTKVMWECPSPRWAKINTDGACRGNPDRRSIRFVLRNEDGDVIFVCGKEIQEGKNSKAEVKAMLEALRYCIEHDYMLIDLHTDSMMLKKVITGE